MHNDTIFNKADLSAAEPAVSQEWVMRFDDMTIFHEFNWLVQELLQSMKELQAPNMAFDIYVNFTG